MESIRLNNNKTLSIIQAEKNPLLQQFFNYFASADFFKDDQMVMSYYLSQNSEHGHREIDRKRRIGELLSTIITFDDDIKYLHISGHKIIPYERSSSESLKTNQHNNIHFKQCSPVTLRLKIEANQSQQQQHSAIIPSVIIQFILQSSYPSCTDEESFSFMLTNPIGLTDRKLSLLTRLASQYVATHSNQELIFGIQSEVKFYLGLLANLDNDCQVISTALNDDEAVEIVLQLGGRLNEALELKRNSLEKSKGVKSFVGKRQQSLNTNSTFHRLRRTPVLLSDLVGAQVLSLERGQTLQQTINRFIYHPFNDPSKRIELRLLMPQTQTYIYTISDLRFVLHITNYDAFDDGGNGNEDQGWKRLRLTMIQFDLSPIAERYGQQWCSIAKQLEHRVLTYFDHRSIKRYRTITSEQISIEQFSRYEHIELRFNDDQTINSNPISSIINNDDEPINDLRRITFILVKEPFPDCGQSDVNDGDDNIEQTATLHSTFSLSALKRMNSIATIRFSDERRHSIISNLLDLIHHLHRCHYFHGHLQSNKIYFTRDGTIKLFDSYFETLALVLIPFVLERELSSIDCSTVIPLTDFSDQFFRTMASYDIFNFGAFILAISSNFRLITAQPIESNLSSISEQLSKHLSSITVADNHRDFIQRCIESDWTVQPNVGMLKNHSFILEWNIRVAREMVQLEQQKNRNDDEENNRFSTALLTNDQNHRSQPSIVDKDDVDKRNSMPNRSIEDFIPMACIGKGGFGYIFEVKNKMDQRKYALKRIYIKEQDMDKMRREVEHLSYLSHQNNKPKKSSRLCMCIQMELCQQYTLHHLIDRNTVHSNPQLRNRILFEIASGLDYMHKNGISYYFLQF
ncbi:Interferon-induced, double-stranded RNA-activated protein kinase [Blomia tropicalis]|nr:Interferon-induced, double-stranded RNA-activated protein kinase [Blomia tropicalis]